MAAIFRSIGPRIAILIALILLAATATTALFSARVVERSMLAASEQSVRNTHEAVQRALEAEFGHLQRFRDTAMAMRQEQLRNVSSATITDLDYLYYRGASGQIDSEVAYDTALGVLRDIRFFNNDYFFTYNRDLIALAHPNPRFEGQDLTDFQDVKGMYVMRDIRALALSEGSGFIEYWWTRLDGEGEAPKLGYVFHYQPWDLIVGTGVYIDDIDEEAARMSAVMREDLAQLFDEVTFGDSGVFFVVDAAAQMEIAPSHRPLTIEGVQDVMLGMIDDLSHSHGDAGIVQSHADAALMIDQPVQGWNLQMSYFEPLGWHLVSAVASAELVAPGRSLAMQQIMVSLVVLFIGLITAYIMVNRIIGNLRGLSDHARGLAGADFATSEQELAQVRALARRSKDEVGQLAGAFVYLETQLQQYISDLTETTASKERIESELRIARDIQMGILPKLFPAFPERDELDLHASIEPAREVGGDLYAFFFIDAHRFCFVIGDVSGKGVPAAFFMAITKTLFRAIAETQRTPGEVLTRVNADLSADNDSCMFVTLFAGTLDTRTGELQYACAGHNPPVLLTDGKAPRFIQVANQPVAGAMPGIEYQTESLVLKPGDVLFTYTDGVNEAMSPHGEILGNEAMMAVLGKADQPSPAALLQAMSTAVARHAAGVEQSDDITMMAFKYFGAK
jgi:sigma-B regulation protein RsbU (phosphoserine phosphatase)